MAFEDWGDSFQDIFNDVPGMDQTTDFDREYLEDRFDLGFTYTVEELEAMGYSTDDVEQAREEFFDYMGIDAADFDWDGWREAMGYE